MRNAKKLLSVVSLVVALLESSRAFAAVASESALLQVAVDQGANPTERIRAFTDLRAVATEQSIPALVELLSDKTWSYAARSVLEVMPGPAAEQALLRALETTRDAAFQIGLVNSLGARRSVAAIAVLRPLLASSDRTLADAAVDALGNIATVEAGEALAAFEPPATLQAAWADALLRIAETVRVSDPTKSIEFAHRVTAHAPPPQAAAAAMEVARSVPEPEVEIVNALSSPQPAVRDAALAALRAGKMGSPLIPAVMRNFSSWPVSLQVQVLSVLYDRAHPAAASLARSALGATDPAVRAAAAKLLSVVGGPSDAPALLALIKGSDDVAVAARLALTRIPGEETSRLLIETFRGGGEARLEALEVLANRGYRPVLGDLLQPVLHLDEATSHGAANAILALATGGDLEAVLKLHGQLPPEKRGPLESVLRRVAARHQPSVEAVAEVMSAAQKLPAAEAGPLLIVLASIGGDAAFEALSDQLKAPSTETRQGAARALGTWRTIQAGPALLAAARREPEPVVQGVMVESAVPIYVRSAAGPNGNVKAENIPAAIEGLRQTWPLAQQRRTKNTILAALRGLKDPRAIAAAGELEGSVAPAK